MPSQHAPRVREAINMAAPVLSVLWSTCLAAAPRSALQPRAPIARGCDISLSALQRLPDPLVAGLYAGGVRALNPLQDAALDATLQGLDVIVHAETGSGKTLAFVVPMLRHVKDQPVSSTCTSVALAFSSSCSCSWIGRPVL